MWIRDFKFTSFQRQLYWNTGFMLTVIKSTAHKFRKFRTRSGGPLPSTTMVWRPKIAAAWEIRYCEEERSIPWEQIVQRRKLKEFCDKKIKKTWDWDGSSGEEALEKTKAPYCCTLNGFPCKSLANDECADMNIDKDIDWNPGIDPGMSLALDRWYVSDANEGGNDWLTQNYLQNRDKEFSKGWGSSYNGEQDNEYKNN
ncbi:hypothetical protein MKW92_012159 [Papaver armeniacum]|nr:hypothetical protein MKW92_012159 [Papaver armeniacum]